MKPTRQNIQQQIRLMQTALTALNPNPPKNPTIIKTVGNPQ